MYKKIIICCLFSIVGLALVYILFWDNGNNVTDVPKNKTEKLGRWTCSMHPDINGLENGSCPLCGMNLVLIDNNVRNVVKGSQFELTDDAVALANVQTIIVGNDSAQHVPLKLSGIITTNAENDAIQTTLFDGRIDALHANSVGKKVRKGQQIGFIYSPELYSAQDKLLTSASYRQTHQKLYDAARNTLGLWKMTDDQIDAMLVSGKPMMNFPLFADVTGTIVEVLAVEGNYYSKGDPLFKISDLNTVWGVFDAYENQLNLLRVGQEVEIKLLSLPNQKIKTRISFIEPVLNPITRTVPVRVVIDNGQGLLKPGMFIDGKVKADIPLDNLITIPKSAVLWTGKRSVVYKKTYDNKAIFEIVEIELGQHLDNSYQVLDGLKLGDVIVIEGAFTIDAAAQLSGKKSMMTRPKESLEKLDYQKIDR